jgi:hypothetical protein
MRWLRSAFGLVSIWALVLALLLALVEGGASAAIFGYDFLTNDSQLAERLHTRYDTLLGWVNRPNVRIPDMYGPGVALAINAQGFRADSPTTTARPSGMRRAICSGDSFTLGYGVANDKTWCRLLATLTPGLETVNMGQGGYGLDQAYLWYMRDGRPFDHDFLITAIITEDLRRMTDAKFFAYPKPLITIDGGRIVVHNVPVPRSHLGRFTTRLARAVSGLRSVELAQRLSARFRRAVRGTAAPGMNEAASTAVALAESLKRTSDEQRRGFVVVWLPVHDDFGSTAQDSLRARFGRALAARNIALIDLVQPLRSLPLEQVDKLFIPVGALDYAGAAGHYTVAGNLWAAHALLDRLMSDTAIARVLGGPRASAPGRRTNSAARGDGTHSER